MIAKEKKLENSLTLTERDLADALEVAKIHNSPGVEVIKKHSLVKEEQILELILHYANIADKEKVFSWACQLAGFRRRANIEDDLIERMNEFIADSRKSEEVIPNDGRREDEP